MEAVTERLQLGDQLLVVVDLAVVDDDDRLVLVVQRLLPGRDVDDGQAPVPERNAGLMMLAPRIRTAMRLRVIHAPQQSAIELALVLNIDNASNSAHGPNLT